MNRFWYVFVKIGVREIKQTVAIYIEYHITLLHPRNPVKTTPLSQNQPQRDLLYSEKRENEIPHHFFVGFNPLAASQ